MAQDAYGPPLEAADADVIVRETVEGLRDRAGSLRKVHPAPPLHMEKGLPGKAKLEDYVSPGTAAHLRGEGTDYQLKRGKHDPAAIDLGEVPVEAPRARGGSPVTLPPVEVEGRRPVARGGVGMPARPYAPPGTHQGHYYPDDYEEELAARLFDDEDPLQWDEYEKRLAAYEQHKGSLEGLMQEQARIPQRGARERWALKLHQMGLDEDEAMDVSARLAERRGQLDHATEVAESRQRRVQRLIDQRLGSIDETLREVQANPIADSRDGGERFFDPLARAMGAFGASLAKTPNWVGQQIDAKIKLDLDLQRDARKAKLAGIDVAKTQLGHLRQKLGDLDMAAAAHRKAIYERHADWVAQRRLADLPERQALKAQEYESFLREQAAVSENQLRQGAEQMALMEEERRRQAAIALMMASRKQPAQGWQRADPKNLSRYVPGAGGFALTDADAKDLREMDAARRVILDNLQRLKEIRGAGLPKTEAEAQAEAIRADTIGAYNKLQKFGALDAGTQELVGTAVGDPTKWFGQASARSDQLAAAVQNSWNRKVTAYGVLPGEVRQGVNDEGAVETQVRRFPSGAARPGGGPVQMGEVK